MQRPRVPLIMVLLVAFVAAVNPAIYWLGWPAWVAAPCLVSALVLGWLSLSRKGRIAQTARKGLLRLPVLQANEVQRIGALLGACDRTCGRCAHFDRAGGQRMLKESTAFAMVTQHLNPRQMESTTGKTWSEDNGFDPKGQPIDVGGPQWTQLGVCRVEAPIGCFDNDSCTRWS